MELNNHTYKINFEPLTQGIALIRDKHNSMVITELYDSPQKGEDLWRTWVDVARRHDDDGQKQTTVELYEVSSLEPFTGRSDKQIMVMLDGVRPDRQIKAIEAEYAARNGFNCYDTLAVQDLIRRHSKRFQRFVNHCNPLMAKLNKPQILQQDQGEFCHSQRVFSVKGGLSFMGSDSIRNSNDVAWIFQQIGKKAVENAYCMMDNGRSRFILHMGMGNISSVGIDYAAIYKAAENFQAKRVWFVHNHPSGAVRASREDIQVWSRLQQMLGDRLYEGIIINTDTGKYGVFDKWDSHLERLENSGIAKDNACIEIPVLTFDDRIFHDKDLSFKNKTLYNSTDVAQFISTQRFGERARAGFLVVNSAANIVGNFFLPDARLEEMDKVAEQIASAAFGCGGVAAMVYGADNYGPIFNEDKVTLLSRLLDKVSCGSVRLQDVVETFQDKPYYSYMDNGLLAEPQAEYNKIGAFDRVDIIPIKGDTGIIRVTKDGQQLPAVRLKALDLRKFTDGKVTADELARQYFRNDHPWMDERVQTSFKR